MRLVYPFLAVSDSRPGGVMVIEGWVPDYCLGDVVAEFHRHRYEKLFVTGGPVDKGGPLAEYKTMAELTGALLFKLGLSSNEVVIAPSPSVRRDRTYTSAKAVETWWRDHRSPASRINLVTVGPHARRSRLMFQKALGAQVEVGVIALAPADFDPSRWWRSSPGFRTVTGEAIAYLYARVLFRRPENEAMP